jgi:hypothetical protein
VSQPEQPPRYFLDRSLGRRAVPEALRADGWDLITLACRLNPSWHVTPRTHRPPNLA